MIALLAEYGVEFVEQPLPPENVEGMRFVRDRSPLPIIGDESCLVASDIPKLRAWWTGSTSSSRSAAGRARRSGWWPSRARTRCS